MPRAFLAAALLALSAMPALANQCPRLMAEVDAALAANPAVSAATLAEVRRLRQDGESLHEAGRHAQSEAALMQALELLRG